MKDTSAGIEKDFYKQTQGESSTSKYIQANTPPAAGDSYGANKVEGTPDDAIINPNLKTATCETKSFEIPFLAKLLGVTLPFVKKTVKKEIAEPAPTGEKAQYGKIRVAQTKGGFVDITDETPGNKRRIAVHPSGSYRSTLDNGDSHEKVVHDKVTIIINDWNITISGDKIEVIDGEQKVQIKRDRQTNINGSDHLNIDKDFNTNVEGDVGVQIGGNNTESIGGNMISEIDGNMTETIKKDHKHTVNGSETNTIMEDRTDIVGGSLNVVVSGNAILHVGGDLNASVDGAAHVVAKGGATIDGGSGAMSGSVTQMCVCPLVMGPHIEASTTVMESK